MERLRWAKTLVSKSDMRVLKRAVLKALVCRSFVFVESCKAKLSVGTKHVSIYAVKCGNHLRVEVRAKTTSVSGFACRPFRWSDRENMNLS